MRDIADDGHIHLHSFGNGSRIDVDMDDLARHRIEMANIADHAVVETRAHRQQHIAILHAQVGFVRAVHAEHADELLVVRRIAAQTHQRIGTRRAEQTHQFGQLLGSVRQDHPAARIHHRAFGFQQHQRSALDLADIALDLRVVGTDIHGRRIANTRLSVATRPSEYPPTPGPGRPLLAR